MNKIPQKLCVLLLISLFWGCLDSDDVGDNFVTFEGKVISTYLEENPEIFSDFTEMLIKVEAFELLKSYGKYTCFIPTNEAVQNYYTQRNTSLENLTKKELKELVFYHLIDGEKNKSKNYFSRDFIIGSIDTQNMVGRYIYTSFEPQSASWIVNNSATIIQSDMELSNGVVHVVDKVLEGNNDLLPDMLKANKRFSIFSAALEATGLREIMLLIDDPSYVAPLTLPNGSPITDREHYPKSKVYGFTILAESDSIMKLREGITDLDGLRQFAKEVYPDYTDEDETSQGNSLNRFVAYHIIPAKIRSNRFVLTYGYISEFEWFDSQRKQEICYDGRYTIEQYHIPIAGDALIHFQKGNIINTDRNVFMENLTSSDEVIRILTMESDLDCQNGILHSLNNMLVYDKYVIETVLHRRIRMDFSTFLPELINNDVIAYANKYNQWHRIIPDDYCAKLKFKEKRPKVYMKYMAPNVHPYLHGDEIMSYGFSDVTFTIGPVPPGTYEVRFGYHSSPGTRGITQIYLDGVPCGVPLDMRLTNTAADIGWEIDYHTVSLMGESGGNPDDPYGYENDKSLRNRNFMKAPDSYTGTVFYQNTDNRLFTARQANNDTRYIVKRNHNHLGGTMEMRFVQMLDGDCLYDYVEFMPVDLIEDEDTH